jgi:hypothetical protein
MRRTIMILACLLCSKLIFAAPNTTNNLQPRATFHKMWVDYDITEDGVRGMRIHLKFSVYEMKDMDAYVAIYFEFNNEKGGLLMDKNKKFYSTAGEVALYKSIKPLYDPADYNDLLLFMPYNELDLDPGNYDLSMDVKLIYKQGGVLAKLTNYDFEYSKPATTSSGLLTPDASLEKLWVDYDVMENGVKGMRIHVNFRVLNMKNIDAYLAIYFEMKDGEKLLTNNKTYRSQSGQVTLYKSLKPGYDESVYNDMQVFMPYDEFHLEKGRFDLKLDADVIYKNGDLVKHLKYHEFWFKQ